MRELRNGLFNDGLFADLRSRRPLWQLMLGGVFDRHPDLRLMMTEVRADWVPDTLQRLDAVFEEHRGDVPARRKPSDYWQANCLAGLSFMHTSRGRAAARDRHRKPSRSAATTHTRRAHGPTPGLPAPPVRGDPAPGGPAHRAAGTWPASSTSTVSTSGRSQRRSVSPSMRSSVPILTSTPSSSPTSMPVAG